MSRHEYEASIRIVMEDYPFYALIMAAMRQADTSNFNALVVAFPGVHIELTGRYNAPGGFLPGEPMPEEFQKALEEVRSFTLED